MTVDLAQFHGLFFEESFESLEAMEAALLEMNLGAPDREGINTIFRTAHSIKGGSATFGFSEIASFTHSVETLLDEVRSGRLQVTEMLRDLLLKSVDTTRAMLRCVQAGQAVDTQDATALRSQFDEAVALGKQGASPPAAQQPAPAPVRAATAPPPEVAPAPARETQAAVAPASSAVIADTEHRGAAAAEHRGGAGGHDGSSIRVGVEKIDELMNTVGELVITQAMLSQLAESLQGPRTDTFRLGVTQLERNVRELQESVMQVRMLPIGFVFNRFPRMAHDLALRLHKQIDLKITGEHTELDKTVLEKIGDPLVHLIRNCIDHGIEKPEQRTNAGKPAAGTVHLDACHKGGHISISVSDDGAGLDAARILAKARQRGLVGPDETPDEQQIHELIFLPGFSTVDQATDVSGRGVGMDVVRRNVKDLGGSVYVSSTHGKGSSFIITLPLTLAIIDGQTVSVGSETYILPITGIIESLQVKPDMVNRPAAASEVIRYRDDFLPVVRLHRLFGVEPRAQELHAGLVIVVEGDRRRFGLFVDELRGQQQVVVKSLEKSYGAVPGTSGATVLGDGSVALILDLPGLMQMAAA